MTDHIKLYATLLVIFLTSVLVISGCQQEQSYPQVNFSVPEAGSDAGLPPEPTKKTLRIALASITSATENHDYYDDLISYLSRSLDLPVQIIQRSTYGEVNVMLRAGLVDVAFICSYAYVTGNEQFGLQLVAAPKVNGKTTYNSYLISRRGEGILKFSDLQGQTFAFTDPMSTSGYFYPVARLFEEKKTPETFFRDHIFTYSHDNSIRAVAEGLADGAAVDSLVFDYLKKRQPELVQNLDIFEVSPPYGAPPVVVRPDLEKGLKDKIRNVVLTMGEDHEGKKILEDLGVEAYVPISDEAYDSVRHLKRMVIRNGGNEN